MFNSATILQTLQTLFVQYPFSCAFVHLSFENKNSAENLGLVACDNDHRVSSSIAEMLLLARACVFPT